MLKGLAPNVKALVADEIKMYMIQEEASIAVTFSGEAADMMWENESLHYILPEEGSNLWFDNMVIPKTAQNKEAAYAFINFMLIQKWLHKMQTTMDTAHLIKMLWHYCQKKP